MQNRNRAGLLYQLAYGFLAGAFLLSTVYLGNAHAKSETERLSECLVMMSSGADRVALVRWMTFAFVSHPSISGEVGVSQAAIEDANKAIAALFVDLLTNRCRTEAKAAFSSDSTGTAATLAFRALGEVSAQEIFGNAQVKDRMSEFLKHIDEKRLEEMLK